MPLRPFFLAVSVAVMVPGAAAAQTVAPAPAAPAPAVTAPPQLPPVASASNARDFTTVADVIAGNPRLGRLTAALQATGLAATLDGNGVYTVFAPEDAALAALSAKQAGDMRRLLGYHVVPGYMVASEMVKQLKAAGGRGSLRTVAGELLIVALDPDGKIVVSDRDGPAFAITQFDLPAFNGVVHTVAGVAVPPPPPKAKG